MQAWRSVAAVVLFACAGSTQADERILAYHSEVAIAADGVLDVRETITVRAEGNRIQRGIFRDFPTDYRGRDGRAVRVPFQVREATRDGAAENFRTETRGNGVRAYLGRGDVLLPPGEYTYVLHYTTEHQVGQFDAHDELYWNVTGNGWGFAIDRASARVTLPQAVPAAALLMEGFTGVQGSTERAVTARVTDGVGEIETTRALAPNEGLTLALGFPKGIVTTRPAPPIDERPAWSQPGNDGSVPLPPDPNALPIGFAGFLLVWVWYLYRWFRVGRDPAPGVVIPEYEAPDGLPPSQLRFLRRRAHEMAGAVADLVHLAQTGHLRIEQNGKIYTLHEVQQAPPPGDAPGREMLDTLFGGKPSLKLDKNAHATLGPALAAHGRAVRAANAGGRWFHGNTWSVAIGFIASIVIIAAAMLLQLRDARAIAGIVVAVLLSATATYGVSAAIAMWNGTRWWPRILSALGAMVATVMVVAASGLLALFDKWMFVLAGGLALANALFAQLMPAYTVAGRKLLDRVEGFVLYLGVAEKDDLARLQAPTMTGERFAALLPYAQALDVEEAWAGRLADAVGAAAATQAAQQAVGKWYSAGNTAFTPSTFASALGSSLGTAIASAATAPGTSSGSSYGGSSGSSSGSSGGGGGGGGGGGW